MCKEMISVLIATYNTNLHPLISELQTQLKDCQIEYEIIIEDDASSDLTIRHHNSLLGEMENITYIEHSKNLGRSKTRNQLANTARYPYLLFMDCDARVKSSNYIAKYLNYIQTHEQKSQAFAVSGGLAYRHALPPKEQQLRYIYGICREVRPSAIRNRHPYQHFTPFNLLISKSVFDICRFDESLTDYGYEDTFFGLDLETQGIPLRHIDNELYHDGLDDNREFLRKIGCSVDNLARLFHDGRVDDRFRAQSKLLRTWEKLRTRFYAPLLFGTLRATRGLLKSLMCNWSILRAMDLYKLSLLDDAIAAK